MTQQRHSRNGDLWEDLKYHYQYADQTTEVGLLRNRLYHVNDAVGQVDPNGSDLDDQGVFEGDPNLIETDNNYVRDEQGRLISNSIEEIELIVWTVSVLSRCMFSKFSSENYSKTTFGRKVKEIIRKTNSIKKNISFDFDAMGNQIAKHIYNNQTGLLEKSTYYILDAQGHQLSIYEHIVDTSSVQYNLAERQIYGSSHIGKTTLTVDMYDETVTNSSTTTTLGYKRFSLSDHRGNVNTVISDIKFPVEDNGNVAYFEAQIINIADYSPFNLELDGRTIKNDFYRYAVQGQERHDEINGEGNYINYKYRGYDPRIGRLDWMIDPLASDYPWNSPYAFSENIVIKAIELEGLESCDINGGDRYYSSSACINKTSEERHKEAQFNLTVALMGLGVYSVPAALIRYTPAVLTFFVNTYQTPAGKKLAHSSLMAAVDFFGQLTINKGDYSKVDQTGVVSNFINPVNRVGIRGEMINNLIQNAFDAFVDYTAEEGLKIVGGSNLDIALDKSISDFTVDLFVGSLVDNLSAGYKAYLKKTMPNIGEDEINEQLKNYGEKMTQYFTTLVKTIISDQGKESTNNTDE